MTDPPGLSVAPGREALGVSNDLVDESTERGELPRLRSGCRKVIPRRAIELLVDSAVADSDPVTDAVAPSTSAGRSTARLVGRRFAPLDVR